MLPSLLTPNNMLYSCTHISFLRWISCLETAYIMVKLADLNYEKYNNETYHEEVADGILHLQVQSPHHNFALKD